MKRLKIKRLLSLAITLMLVFQAMPLGTPVAAGETGRNLLSAGTNWAKIHDESGAPVPAWPNPPSIKSFIKITDKSGNEIPRTGIDSYTDIPAGAKIELNLGFHLLDRDEASGIDYKAGDYFYFDLPNGVVFNATGPTKFADWGEWAFDGNRIKVTLTDGLLDTDYELWGLIQINGTFQPRESGDGADQSQIKFGDQTITIKRTPYTPPTLAPKQGTLEKTGTYDPTTNLIHWTVKVKAAEDETLNGTTFVDTLTSGNHSYVAGSFKVDGIPNTPTAENGSWKYTFPAANAELEPIVPAITEATITYDSTPTTNNWSAAQNFQNRAELFKDAEQYASPVTGKVTTPALFVKGGQASPTEADPSRIRWEITVTIPSLAPSGEVTLPNAVITDKMDARLVRLDSPAPELKLNGETADIATSGTLSAVDGSNQFTYQFGDGKLTTGMTATLIYYTKVKEADYQSAMQNNGAISFTNDASFTWSFPPGGPGVGNTPSITAGITKSVVGGGLLNKTVDGPSLKDRTVVYDTKAGQDDYIKWVVTVNANHITMNDGVMSDVIPSGQKLVISAERTLTVTKTPTSGAPTSKTYSAITTDSELTAAADGGFTYALAATTSDKYVFEFWTQIVDMTAAKDDAAGKDRLYLDNPAVYKNDAELKYKDAGGTGKTLTSSAQKRFTTDMLQKINAGYNYADRTVEWTLKVNTSHLPMTNAVITDTLPAGMVLVGSDIGTFTVKVNKTVTASHGITFAKTAPSGEGSATAFTLTLPTSTSYMYEITYKTTLPDGALSAQWSGDQAFKNEAKLVLAERPTGYTAESTVNVKNPVLNKTGAYVKNDAEITWTIDINVGQVNLKDAVVTDTATPANVLELDETSVKLYKVGVNADGEIKPGDIKEANLVPATGGAGGYTLTPGTGGSFTLALPDGAQAYRLVYVTTVKEDNVPSPGIQNSVAMSGGTSPTGSVSGNAIVITNQYSTGGKGNYQLMVTKVDEQGNPVPGAKFKLVTTTGSDFKQSGSVKIITTGADGKGIFEGLPGWAFYVEETEPAPGYLMPLNPKSASTYTPVKGNPDANTIKVTNVLGMAPIEIAKVGETGEKLTGGSFSLLNSVGTAVQSGVAAVDGKVSFAAVPFGTYTVREDTPPEGHAKTDSVITAKVDYKAGTGKTEAGVTYSPNATLKNDATGVTVEFSKVDAANAAIKISGGSFGLYNSANTLVGTAQPAANGVVSFPNVGIGSYTIRELTAPDGYLNPNGAPATTPILRVEVAYDTHVAGSKKLVYAVMATGSDAVVTDFANTRAVADVVFNKVHSTNDKILISGGLFELRGKAVAGFPQDKDGDFVVTAAAKDGVVVFKDVPVNANGASYTIKELSAPGGYLSTKETLTVTVSYTNSDKTAVATPVFSGQNGDTLKNEPAPMGEPKARISVLKTDEKGNKLAGAVFTIAYRNGTGILQTVTTGSDGIALFEGIVLYKEYIIRETAAPKGYKLSDTEISLNPQKENEIYTFTVVNQKIDEKGSVSVLKTDEKGGKLAGATFTLYDKDGAAVASAVSDADGIAKFADVPANAAYTIRETAAPKGYERSAQVLSFTLEKDAALSFTMVNRKIVDKGSVSVLKTDEKGNKLAGATFTLYDKDGAAVASAVSGSNGIAKFADIPANAAYTIRETAAPKGYERSAQVFSFTLEKNTALSFTMVNRKIGENQAQTYGSLTIMKVGPNNVRLADAEFTLYDAAGKRVMSTVTGEDGIAKFTNLALGSYSVRETRAPAGYQLADEALNVAITAERLNKKFTLRNAKVGEEPGEEVWEEIIVDIEDGELPYTGSTFGDQFFLLAGVSLLAIGFVTLLPHKKGGKHLADPAQK